MYKKHVRSKQKKLLLSIEYSMKRKSSIKDSIFLKISQARNYLAGRWRCHNTHKRKRWQSMRLQLFVSFARMFCGDFYDFYVLLREFTLVHSWDSIFILFPVFFFFFCFLHLRNWMMPICSKQLDDFNSSYYNILFTLNTN